MVKPLATARDYADGETVFRAGQADHRFVHCGVGRDRDPQSDGRRSVIVVHEPGSSPATSTC